MNLTPEDEELFKTVAEKFQQNVKANYKGDVKTAFMKAAGPLKTLKLARLFKKVAKSKDASLTERAKANAELSGAALPIMKKAFGEEFLISALPEEAKNERVIEICNHFGQKELADLCRKAMGPRP